MKPPVLEGKRILLRPINTERDSMKWYEVMQDEKMHLWTGNTVPASISETKEYFEKLRNIEGIIPWAVTIKQRDEIIGTYWIALPQELKGKLIITCEAQRISREYWRTGITREARILVYDYAFKVLGAQEIYAQAWSENTNSCKSMEQIGFTLVKEYDKINDKYKKQLKEKEYMLSKEVWESKKLGAFNC